MAFTDDFIKKPAPAALLAANADWKNNFAAVAEALKKLNPGNLDNRTVLSDDALKTLLTQRAEVAKLLATDDLKREWGQGTTILLDAAKKRNIPITPAHTVLGDPPIAAPAPAPVVPARPNAPTKQEFEAALGNAVNKAKEASTLLNSGASAERGDLDTKLKKVTTSSGTDRNLAVVQLLTAIDSVNRRAASQQFSSAVAGADPTSYLAAQREAVRQAQSAHLTAGSLALETEEITGQQAIRLGLTNGNGGTNGPAAPTVPEEDTFWGKAKGWAPAALGIGGLIAGFKLGGGGIWGAILGAVVGIATFIMSKSFMAPSGNQTAHAPGAGQNRNQGQGPGLQQQVGAPGAQVTVAQEPKALNGATVEVKAPAEVMAGAKKNIAFTLPQGVSLSQVSLAQTREGELLIVKNEKAGASAGQVIARIPSPNQYGDIAVKERKVGGQSVPIQGEGVTAPVPPYIVEQETPQGVLVNLGSGPGVTAVRGVQSLQSLADVKAQQQRDVVAAKREEIAEKKAAVAAAVEEVRNDTDADLKIVKARTDNNGKITGLELEQTLPDGKTKRTYDVRIETDASGKVIDLQVALPGMTATEKTATEKMDKRISLKKALEGKDINVNDPPALAEALRTIRETVVADSSIQQDMTIRGSTRVTSLNYDSGRTVTQLGAGLLGAGETRSSPDTLLSFDLTGPGTGGRAAPSALEPERIT